MRLFGRLEYKECLPDKNFQILTSKYRNYTFRSKNLSKNAPNEHELKKQLKDTLKLKFRCRKLMCFLHEPALMSQRSPVKWQITFKVIKGSANSLVRDPRGVGQ